MEFFGHKPLNFISRPTQLHEFKALQKELGVKPRIFVKRDDLTEVGLGGNKTRKLDYLMAEAVEQKCDCVVTWAGLQSNHSRQTIAYAVKLGMEPHVVVNGVPQEDKQGNLFVFDVFGAKTYYEADEDLCEGKMQEIADQLKKQGKNPYVVPIGASVPLGSIGYIESMKEVSEQAKALGVNFGALFVATGSAGTQAGLEIGRRLYAPYCTVEGVAVSRESLAQRQKVAKLVNETAQYIGSDIRVCADDLKVLDQYAGKYAVPTEGCIEAIKLVGRTEAVMLDPVYSGKAMAGMIDQLKKGNFDHCEAVVFLHTGGSPAIYHYTKWFD